jgi:pimeloyl-ACP methyl ester carboxylesterase
MIFSAPRYEDRDGEPTEKNLFAAATEALQTLPTNLPIYLIGESLGSGVASYLAGTYPNKISGLILNFSVQPVDQCRAKSLSNFAGLVIAYGSFPFGKISTQFSRQSWNHD